MCLTCGCLLPTQDHGDARNLVLSDLVAAAQAGGVSVEEAADNVPTTLHVSIAAGPVETFAERLARPVLVFDIDGVLAFLAETIAATLNARFGTSYRADRMYEYDVEDVLPPEQSAWLVDQFGGPDIYANSAPDFHAIDFVNRAARAGYTVYLATDRSPDLDEVTEEWLDRWGVDYTKRFLLGPGGKVDFMAGFATPAVLFDDDPAKQDTIPSATVALWAPRRPWTPETAKPGVWVFDDWDAVVARLLPSGASGV